MSRPRFYLGSTKPYVSGVDMESLTQDCGLKFYCPLLLTLLITTFDILQATTHLVTSYSPKGLRELHIVGIDISL